VLGRYATAGQQPAKEERQIIIMAATIISCRFVPTPEQAIPVEEVAEDNIDTDFRFREEMRREYWHEAIDAGMTTVEAAEYASKMTED